MKKIIVLLLLLLAGTTARSENITNKGKVYYDVAIVTSRCTAVSITFSHRAGIAKIDFMELSGPNQKRFGFDPARYQEFKQAQPTPPTVVPPPALATPPPTNTPPVTTPLAPSRDFIPIKRVVVITNTPPHFTPFGASPETTIRPDNDKMNDARLKIMKKAIGINSYNGN